ncbi:MAG: creatininase family protein [Thermoguttaceae bacterium]|jgi:creatinine amidohydrolase|nr:creatininase family protein [Thermoguttaceae bacterium]
MSQSEDPSRRDFLAASLAGAAVGVLASGQSAEAASPSPEKAAATVKVRYAELLPHEFRKRLAERPIAYLPLGTLEWHGEHLPLGADALQSEGLMIECARRLGGIVMPPIYLGPDRAKPTDDGKMLVGMDYADSTTPPRQLDGSCYWVPMGLHLLMVDAILAQLQRAGFRAVFADGHGPSRWSWVENLSERQARFGLKLFGVTKDISRLWKSQVDHAARNETSLVMHLRPDLVDLSQLPASRSVWPQGVARVFAADATAAHGKECFEQSVELVRQMFAQAGLL